MNSDWQDLSADAQQCREVFARFGLAMYFSQCLEIQIGLMLATMFNRQFLSVPYEDRDALFDKSFSNTLGRMMWILKKDKLVSPTLESRLERAVGVRNWLAHRYFYERSREFPSHEGREAMISELQCHAHFLQETDVIFTELMKKWRRHIGVSDEDVSAEMERFLSETDRPSTSRTP